MTELPFDLCTAEFLEMVRNNQVMILAAATGAGKSTKAPLALLSEGFAGDKTIVVSEPRRLATILLAEWVAYLYGTDVGEVVGYQIAQDRMTSRETKLVYKTEGILLAEMRSDPLLHQYSVIFLDEVHERGVNQDLLMALVRDVLPRRPDLKVIISSATISIEKFSGYFAGAPVLNVPGRTFPVEVRYAKGTPKNMSEMVAMIIETIDKILLSDEDGDVLVFMPDYASITKVCLGLAQMLGPRAKKIRIHQLYGNQLPADRDAALKRDKARRVIVATNIAETSVTVDGLTHCIDSGLIKSSVYVNAFMSAFQIVEHSQAGCDQRLGRVGRTSPGICHRMFAEENFTQRDSFTTPEILRISLDEVLLNLRCLGYSIEQVLALDLMDKPKAMQWKDAEVRLKTLGAMNSLGEVTQDGVDIHRFKVAPMIGRMLLEGKKRECLEEIVIVAACLSAQKFIFVRPGDKQDEADAAFLKFRRVDSDPLTMLKAWDAWNDRKGDEEWARGMFFSSEALQQVDRIRDGLLELLEEEKIPVTRMKNELELKKAIAAGLIVNLARLNGQNEYLWNNESVYIFPGSALKGTTPRFVVCANVVETTRVFMRSVHAVEKSWIPELLSLDACLIELEVEIDFVTGEPSVLYKRSWNGMEIENKLLEVVPKDLAPHLAAVIMKQLQEDKSLMSESFPFLAKLWRRSVPPTSASFYGEERRRQLRPKMDQFTRAMAKKIEGQQTLNEVFQVIGSMTAEDVLFGDQLQTYQTEQAAEKDREREATERRARVLRENREAEQQAEARVAPHRELVNALHERLSVLGAVRVDQRLVESVRRAMDDARYLTDAAVQDLVDAYRIMVEGLELGQAARFEFTRRIYSTLRETMPFCPVCGSAWDKTFTCHVRHLSDRIMKKLTTNEQWIGSFKTDQGEEAVKVRFEDGQSVKVWVSVRENAPWHGRAFESIVYHPNLVLLPESLLQDRDLILEYLQVLESAKKSKNKAETDRVTGEMIALFEDLPPQLLL